VATVQPVARGEIPRILHQVWLGPKPLPEEFGAYRETWREHHPGWRLELWTEDRVPEELRRPEVYDRLRVPAERADILRLEVLWRFGGVYVDTDFECRRSIEPLIAGVDFFTAYLKPGRVNNAIIGAVPGHPILDRALRELRPNPVYGYDKEAAGPLFFDRLIKDYPETKVFEPPVFYPSTPGEREQAVAIHHVARSWKDAEGFEQASIRARERIRRVRIEIEREREAQKLRGEDLAEIRRRLHRAEAGMRPDPPLLVRAFRATPRVRAAIRGQARGRRQQLAHVGRGVARWVSALGDRIEAALPVLPVLGRRASSSTEPGGIPTTIHQIWLSPEPMPKSIRRSMRSWRKRNRSWDHRLWTEENLPDDPVRVEVRETIRSSRERSQFLRLEVLGRFGGVYVDPDVVCRRPLTRIDNDPEFFAASFANGAADESLLGASPGHPLVERLLAELKATEYWGETPDRVGRLITPEALAAHDRAELLPAGAVVYEGEPGMDGAVAVRTAAREREVDVLKGEAISVEQELAGIQRQLDDERRRTAELEAELKAAVAALDAARTRHRRDRTGRATAG
jgi:mannosyltransferase OCH1-like enzyme